MREGCVRCGLLEPERRSFCVIVDAGVALQRMGNLELGVRGECWRLEKNYLMSHTDKIGHL